MNRLRLITLTGEPEKEADVVAELATRNDVEVVLRCVERAEVLGSVKGAEIDGILSVGVPRWLDREVAALAARKSVRLVALVDHPLDAEHVRTLGGTVLPLDTGADQILAAYSTETPTEPLPPEPAPFATGKLIAVWGPKGAPGRTSLAMELAAELAARDAPTLLIDADTYGGDILQLLGITEELSTLVWASRMAAKGELDPDTLRAECKRVGRVGPAILPGVPRPDLWPEISDFGWRELLGVARNAYRFTVADVGFCLEPSFGSWTDSGDGRNRVARACLREADLVMAIVRGDPPGIKNFVWAMEELKGISDSARVFVVANRVRSGEERELSELIRRYTGQGIRTMVPDSPDLFLQAVSNGRFAREIDAGVVSSSLRPIVDAIAGPKLTRGFLARLGGKV